MSNSKIKYKVVTLNTLSGKKIKTKTYVKQATANQQYGLAKGRMEKDCDKYRNIILQMFEKNGKEETLLKDFDPAMTLLDKSVEENIKNKGKKVSSETVSKKKVSSETVSDEHIDKNKPLSDSLKTINRKANEVRKEIGSLNDLKKNQLKSVMESVNVILGISKAIMGAEPIYKSKDGKVVIDDWGMPEVVKMSFELFELKQLIDFQFELSGHLGFIGTTMAQYQANAGLKKAIIDVASHYMYVDTKNYIIEEIREKKTDKYIEAIINSDETIRKQYIAQRKSASIAKFLETVYKTGELMRNVLNATIQYRKEDMINSAHLNKSQLQNT